MGNKNVNILLRLTDQFTGPLQKTTKEIKTSQREIQRASNMVKRWHTNSVKAFSQAAKAASVAAAAIGGIALKTGLTEALDLEGYKMQLETATKDTQRAAEVMKYAINLANKTPFEGGELVEAASSLEMFGLKTERWLPTLGDAASAVNREISDIQRGFVDAVTTGDFTSLRDTLSITKEMVDEYAKTNFGKSFQNAKGQITDLALLQDSLEGLMQSRFAGGMEKQATTIRGMWSTVTGVTKNALANILGMQNDGTIKSGSLLDSLREKIKLVSDTLTRWQQDGTIEKISAKASTAFEKISSAIDWVIDHFDTLSKVASVGLGIWGSTSVITGVVNHFRKFADTIGVLKKGFSAFKELGGLTVALAPLRKVITVVTTSVKGLFSVIAANPIAAVIVLITAAVTAIIMAYNESETFRNFVNKLGSGVVSVFTKIKDTVISLKDKFVSAFQTIQTKVSSIVEKIKKFLQPLIDLIDSIKNGLKNLGFGSSSTGYSVGSLGGKATGTPYFKGGLTRINEGGRGEIVNLPNGTQIIPHDVAKKSQGGTSIAVNLTVQGNLIGNRAFMEQTGDYIVSKIIAAQGVV